MRRTLKLAVIIVIGLSVSGCVVEKDSTGKKTVRVDAAKAEQIEKGVEAGIGITGALAIVWPGFAAASIGLAGLLAAWRKQKGKLVVEQTKTEMHYSVTAALVEAIDGYREDNPTHWNKLKEKLASAIGPEGENIIRALRDLPDKT